MIFLADRAEGRDNNLNLLRVLAALAVLVSHAVPIAVDPALPEPLEQSVGKSLGTLAVLVFFAISGFLIPMSFERTPNYERFIAARALRIFPGLLVNLLFVALVLGPLVTELPLQVYLSDPAIYLFILRDLFLVPLAFTLPGVFEGQPTEAIVGSIWTLRHEVACYIGAFILGVAGLYRWLWLYRVTGLFYVFVVWPAIAWFDQPLHPLVDEFSRLSVAFVVGMIFHAWRALLPLSLWGVATLFGLAWVSYGTNFYHPTLCLAIGYSVFWLGYVPGGVLRLYNRIGDYSYGIYVYAFPIQGWAVWAFGEQSALENVLYALPPTLILSVISWHLVENPAMSLAKMGRWGGSRPRESVRSIGPPEDFSGS